MIPVLHFDQERVKIKFEKKFALIQKVVEIVTLVKNSKLVYSLIFVMCCVDEGSNLVFLGGHGMVNILVVAYHSSTTPSTILKG